MFDNAMPPDRIMAMTPKVWISIVLVLLALLLLAGCKLTRAGYESAGYKVVRRSGSFEIRDYPALTLVSTPMGPAQAANADGFRKLSGYISGANEAQTKIAMTTPVFTDPSGTNRQMSFVVPKAVAAVGAPEATRDDIAVETRLAGRFAMYRFSGSWDAQRTASAGQKLIDWVVGEKLQAVGEPQVANYDPPFTPPFLRRNEVLVRVKDD